MLGTEREPAGVAVISSTFSYVLVYSYLAFIQVSQETRYPTERIRTLKNKQGALVLLTYVTDSDLSSVAAR